jgi:PPOX class probable F420-dependent enzyme
MGRRSLDRVDVAEALAFVEQHHRCLLVTRRRDGSLQTSPNIVVAVDRELWLSSRETAYKVRNLRRDPRCSITVVSDAWFGPWVQIDGTARIISLPEAMEPLVEYYRLAAGEHDDWDDYRQAMERDRRVIIAVTPQRAGPDVAG